MQVIVAVVTRIAVAALVFGVVSVPLALSQSASEPDLSGNWVDSSNASDKITIQEKGNKIQVHETDGDKVTADYTCSLSGQQCESKEDGHSAKVMIYYNGSKLVEITERGSDVSKRRFSLSKDGNTMSVEIIPVSSEGNTTTRTYQKQDAQVANQP
jgi:hypothetical protein